MKRVGGPESCGHERSPQTHNGNASACVFQDCDLHILASNNARILQQHDFHRGPRVIAAGQPRDSDIEWHLGTPVGIGPRRTRNAWQSVIRVVPTVWNFD
eukprot:469525-Rhodomonas_salina.1